MSDSAPFRAYQGSDPFVFVSYAHANTKAVFPIIAALHQRGFRIWYDEGINPGEEWPDSIASAMGRAHVFLLFATPAAMASRHVRNEIAFAANCDLPCIVVYLEPTEVPPGVALQIGTHQAVTSNENPQEQSDRLLAALARYPVREGDPSEPPAQQQAPVIPAGRRFSPRVLVATGAAACLVVAATVIVVATTRGPAVDQANPPPARVVASLAPPAVFPTSPAASTPPATSPTPAVTRSPVTKVIDTIKIGAPVSDIVINTVDGTAYVTGDEKPLVSVLDGTTHKQVDQWFLNWQPLGDALDQESGRIFVTDLDKDRLVVLSAQSGTLQKNIPTQKDPARVALHPTLPRAYVSNGGSDSVTVVDTESLTVVTNVKAGQNPAGLVVDPVSGYLFVANRIEKKATVSVIDTANNKLKKTIKVGGWAFRVTVDPSRHYAFVLNAHGHTISVIDTTSLKVVKTIKAKQLGHGPVAAAVDDSSDTLYVSLADDNAVALIDLNTLRVTKHIPLGKNANPAGIQVDPRTGQVLVANKDAETVSVLG